MREVGRQARGGRRRRPAAAGRAARRRPPRAGRGPPRPPWPGAGCRRPGCCSGPRRAVRRPAVPVPAGPGVRLATRLRDGRRVRRRARPDAGQGGRVQPPQAGVTRSGVGVLVRDHARRPRRRPRPGRCTSAASATGGSRPSGRDVKKNGLGFADEFWLSDGTRGRLAALRSVALPEPPPRLHPPGDPPLARPTSRSAICVFGTPAAALALRSPFFGLSGPAVPGGDGGPERPTLAAAAGRAAPDVPRGRGGGRVRPPGVRTLPRRTGSKRSRRWGRPTRSSSGPGSPASG